MTDRPGPQPPPQPGQPKFGGALHRTPNTGRARDVAPPRTTASVAMEHAAEMLKRPLEEG